MRENWILTKKEIEFMGDWFDVLEGKMDRLQFFIKWSTRKEDSSFYEDYLKVEKGEMSFEEFRGKWSLKGDWKDRIRVMRHRIVKKRRKAKEIMEKIREEVALMDKFMSLEDWP
ncbi:MAG: hypothetical protein NZ894_05880 [Archaeoglobaceae archaeon]|nr:hypothetical protein [Archaeoglobaceae archaeon]